MGQPAIYGQRVAFFGGSFDPPHLGHLAVARAAQRALHLNTVLFAPVGTQPLKPEGATAPFADRVAMTRLAVAGEPGFAVSTIDAPIAASAPNYTLDTLRRLKGELEPGAELFFLMGADSFFSLRRWHRAAEIPFAASLIVASRPGQPLDDVRAGLPDGLTLDGLSLDGRTKVGLTLEPATADHAAGVPMEAFTLRNATGETAKLYLLPGLHVDISASAIRQDVLPLSNNPQAAADDRDQGARASLPASVLGYIRSHQIYR